MRKAVLHLLLSGAFLLNNCNQDKTQETAVETPADHQEEAKQQQQEQQQSQAFNQVDNFVQLDLAGDTLKSVSSADGSASTKEAATPTQTKAEARRLARQQRRDAHHANKLVCQPIFRNSGNRIISVGESDFTIAGQKVVKIGNVTLTPQLSTAITERYIMLDNINVNYCKMIQASNNPLVVNRLIDKQAEIIEKIIAMTNAATQAANAVSSTVAKQDTIDKTTKKAVGNGKASSKPVATNNL